MNHVYRLLWNEISQSFIAVSEMARSRGKRSGGGKAAALALGAMLAGAAMGQALPGGARVSSGQAAVSGAGATLTVRQGTDKATINWDSFSIGKGGTVNFVQPSAASVVLNRVVGTEKSVIDGALNANGQVFLLNSNGVLFGRSASVNTAGLVASTMALSDADFNAANYRFSNKGSQAAVLNLGDIHVADGGYAALLGRQVANGGTITARLGTVALAAGDKLSLNFNGNSLLNVTLDKGVLGALVENRQAIYADGGLVILTAKAVDALLANVVNNTGEIRARTVDSRAGRIYLLGGLAEGGSASVAGTLDASAPDGGDGGFIETSAAHLNIDGAARVSTYAPRGRTGNWLMDPNDYTIAASGGNITGAVLAASLNNNNVTIQTSSQGTGGGNGDIFVNDAVAKTGAGNTTLTLLAERNIAVNQPITSSAGRLNVVLTADADANSSGNVAFGAAGHVLTHNGNATVGAIVSQHAVARQGLGLSMASGSFIDAGSGNLDISVAGDVNLTESSLRATNGNAQSLYNDGSLRNFQPTAIRVDSLAGIYNTGTDPAIANIVASTDVSLNAATLGSLAHRLTLSAPATGFAPSNTFSNVARTLSVSNYGGNSYIAEIGTQLFGAVNVAVGTQTNSAHNIELMGDAGGNGATGTGHILLNTDGAGLLNLANKDVDTSGLAALAAGDAPRIYATSVSLSAPNINFANGSVNTGGRSFYYPGVHNGSQTSYAAGFTASASGALASSAVDNVADITATTLTLNAHDVGTVTHPLELGAGETLNTYNSGGSTYLKSTADSYNNLTLTNVKTAGSHSLLFSGGDHINYSGDGSKLLVDSIGATSGIDVRLGNRSVTLVANSGYLEFNTDAVNTGGGAFGATISNGNVDRSGGKAILASNAKDNLAEITAGNVSFSMWNVTTPGAISAIEIAKGGVQTTNSLTVNTYGGDVDLRELTPNHFKYLSVNLNGVSQAQNIAIDLNGPDDVNFSDSGSLLTLGAGQINLSSNNRNWSLQAGSRAVQIDGTALGSGSYTVNAGTGLALNGDVLTNGGAIFLSSNGSGLKLLRSVRIDSNADDLGHSAATGAAGSVYLGGNLSAGAPGYALSVNAASSSQAGATIQMNGSAGNTGGAYLGALSVNSKGSTNTNDGQIYLYGASYLLNGGFAATGDTYLLNATTIDTEQGNVGSAGNISFAGKNLSNYPFYQYRFDTSTTAAGFNGGNIDLAATYLHAGLNGSGMAVDSRGGAGGAAGAINLPAVATVYANAANTQTYNGGIITLNGDLATDKGNVTLNGDVRLAGNIAITTWLSSTNQSGVAGAVSIGGVGVSAGASGRSLTINTGSNTGSGFFTGSTDWSQGGGAVSVKAGNAGGAYLDTLTVNTAATGTHNGGAAGAIALNGVATTGAQSYVGGAATIAGDLGSNGGAIDLSGAASLTLGTGQITIKTDMVGGSSAAGALLLGANSLNGPGALSIDTTADGGGAAADLSLNALGDSAALASLRVRANSLALGGTIHASGDITLQSLGGALDLVLDHAIGSDAGDIALASAAHFVNHVGSGAFTLAGGHHWQVWTAAPTGDTQGGLLSDFKQYNAQFGVTGVLGAGNGFLYQLAPTISVALTGSVSKVYDGGLVATLSGANFLQSGAIDGDIVVLAGTGAGQFDNANAGSAKQIGVSDIGVASASNGAQAVYGYQLASSSAAGAIGVITPKTLTISGLNGVSRSYDGTLAATLSGGALVGLVGAETLNLSGLSGVFADKNVGTAKAISADGIALGNGGAGGLASNYSLAPVTGLMADITARALTVSAVGVGRVYDGGTGATVTLADNRVSGDQFSVATGGASFADKNVGVGKAIGVLGIHLDGADAGNYSVNATAGATADITARALTVSAVGAGRVYDGGTGATVTLADNRVSGDQFSVATGSASFADKNVGVGKAIGVPGIHLDGADAGNYSVNATAGATADITARALTVSAVGVGRVYDGSTGATVTLADNRVAGDQFSVATGGASFADKNVGIGKAIGVPGIHLDGADAGNYSVNATAGATADITARALTVSAVGVGRVYDGSTGATVTLGDNRVAGDQFSVATGSASFADKNVGVGKAIGVPGIHLDGADAGNYSVNATAGATADITARALTVSAVGVGRVYDGGTGATVTLADNRVAGDQFSVATGGASFADKHVGVGKLVSVSGIELSGADAGNYSVNATAGATADITARALTVDASAASKRQDGNRAATVTLSDNRVAGDVLTLAQQDASFSDSLAGVGKTVTVTGISVAGVDAGNYLANTSATTSADITSVAALTDIVTTIVNKNSLSVPLPGNLPTTLAPGTRGDNTLALAGFPVTAQMPLALNAGFGEGSRIVAVMAAPDGAPVQRVSSEGMRQFTQPDGDGTVRIPLGRNSRAAVVNGGVRLPDGVTQDFFITPSK
ncbi:filamentous hemagglutinin family protein [Oxalobacteraceae bacterium GrIS 1.11]